MTTQFEDVATRIETADEYVAFFGPADNPTEYVKRTYRQAVRIVYPDYHTGRATFDRASDAFKRLTDFYNDALEMIGRGMYGQPKMLVTWTSRRATHEVFRPLGMGDLCATFNARTRANAGGDQRVTFCKVAMNASDNDLVQTEATVLTKLHKELDTTLHPFFPELVDSFGYREPGKTARRVNVLAELEGFYTLAQVREAFPDGLEAIHVAWIWRRMLWAIGHANRAGVLHGALLPMHVMILPAQHGVVLTDWCYASVKTDTEYEPLKALVGAYKDWYPEEVPAKQAPSPATDLCMAARCAVDLMGGDPLTGNFPEGSSSPKAFRAFFKGCLSRQQQTRPQDGLRLLGEFDELLKRLGAPYYPRKFRQFVMPERV